MLAMARLTLYPYSDHMLAMARLTLYPCSDHMLAMARLTLASLTLMLTSLTLMLTLLTSYFAQEPHVAPPLALAEGELVLLASDGQYVGS